MNISESSRLDTWPDLVLVALMFLVLLWRSHDEEALMREEFRQDWESYSKRSWRLMPLLY